MKQRSAKQLAPRIPRTSLDLDYAKSVLRYEPETGNFYWKIDINTIKYKAGDLAGSSNKSGYKMVMIRKKYWLAHRLAWAFFHGALPKGIIDHIDKNPSNNRIDNLREVTTWENAQNKRKKPKEFVGLHYQPKRKGWDVVTKLDGKQIYVGFSTDPIEARAMYLAARGDKR